MNDSQAHALASRFIRLAPEKRRVFLDALKKEGVDFAAFPIVSSAGEPARCQLSYAQQRMWFLWQLDPDSAAYNLPTATELSGPLNVEALTHALNSVVARHEILRTLFPTDEQGQPYQFIRESAAIEIDVENLISLPSSKQGEEVKVRIEQESLIPFDLVRGPLLRVNLFELGEQRHVLLITLHHVVTDGWSINVLIDEVMRFYEAYTTNTDADIMPLTIQYADYGLWQRSWLESGELQRQLDYWCKQLGGDQPVLELPVDHARTSERSFVGARYEWKVDSQLADGLRVLAKTHNASLFMVLLAAFKVLLYRYTGESDIRIGVPVANRHRSETEGLIGCFINTQVMRAAIDDQETFADLLGNVRSTVLDAQSNQELPFEKLVDALKPERMLTHNPLFQVMFNHQALLTDVDELSTASGLRVHQFPWDKQTTEFDLKLDTWEKGSEISAAFTYSPELFDITTIERLADHWQGLLEKIVGDPGRSIAEVSQLSESEKQRILKNWNATQVDYGEWVCIQQLFEAQVEKTPEAVALRFSGRRGVGEEASTMEQVLTYAELNVRSNRLAHTLRESGVGPDVLVGLALERSAEMVIGLLAIIKAGGAYVPLDPEYPADRLAYMMADSGASLVLTYTQLRDTLPIPADVRVLCLDDSASSGWHQSPESNLPLITHPNHLAYVIYTSGSTGRPKGVGNTHQALHNRLAWMQVAYGLSVDDSVLQKTPFSFDVSVWEFFWPLLNGARLVMAAPGDHREHERLTAVIQQAEITTVHFVPSMLQAFMQHSSVGQCHSLRQIICSGEALSAELQHQVLKTLPFAKLHNLYGPTEAAIDVTHWTCVGDSNSTVPIGRPIANIQTYIQDGALNTVPEKVVGELYLGGVGLARGYHGKPGLTAERFVPDPYDEAGGGRLYRTGDLARYRLDGVINYQGRIDHQVKIRGLRIELGEIESQLSAQGSVQDAVVVAQALRGAGSQQLVAYVVPGDSRLVADEVEEDTLDSFRTELKTHLQAILPEYMVPSQYVLLDRLPVTPNGKLDRKALPAVDGSAFSRIYAAPDTELEKQIAGIWQEVLGVERVGLNDSFFELGGHSLLSIQLLGRVRDLGWVASVRDLFLHSQLGDFVQSLKQPGDRAEWVVPPNGIPEGCKSLVPEMVTLVDLGPEELASIEAAIPGGAGNIQDIYPLAPLQEGIFFHHLLEDKGDAYIVLQGIRFVSREKLEQFIASFNRVIARHDILRTAILWEGLSDPVQVVYRQAPLALQWLEVPQSESVAEHLRTHVDKTHYRLDVRRAPMIEAFAAYDAEQDQYVLQLANHHLVSDHTTLEQIIQEIGLIQEGRETELPDPLPFRNFVAQARSGVTEQEHEDFFTHMLGEVDEPSAPFGLIDVAGDGTAIRESRQLLSDDLAQAVRQQAQHYGVSAASLFHLAWGLVVANTTGRKEAVFGTVLFGRMQGVQGAERALGLFINTLPLRVDLHNHSVEQALRSTQASLAELMHHEHASLALAQRCSALPGGTPLFSTLLNYRYSAPEADSGPQIAWEGMEPLASEERTNYPITLSVDDWGAGFSLEAQVVQTLDAQRICGYVVEALTHLAESLAKYPTQRVSEISVLSEAERTRILKEWNATEVDYGKVTCIHKLFEEQVEKTPEATALVFPVQADQPEQVLTYTELNTRSNQLAHTLRGMGVGPDVLVGIAVERSVEMVIGLLGVLKAGGAYVPLDPEYPQERLDYMMADSGISLLLTQSHLRASLRIPDDINVLCLDEDYWRNASTANLAPVTRPDNLAYMIYTSGSTGRPKGVSIQQCALNNHMCWMQETLKLNADDRILQKTAFSFDASVWEFWLPLITGAQLVLAPPLLNQSMAQLWKYIAEYRVTTLQLVPSLLQVLLPDASSEQLVSLKRLLLGGEIVTPQLVSQLASRWEGALYNLYGPTESTIDATCWRYTPDDSTVVPIGYPIANNQVYILGNSLQPAPLGIAGELHIGGAGLARGYRGRPGLTAERFVPDPYDENGGGRLYRSGDLGRYRADGAIEYAGRIDHQVKIRGFRIELGEIESQLQSQADIKDAVVLAQTVSDAGSQQLVAYVVPSDSRLVGDAADETALDKFRAEVKDHLQATLPEHMVPNQYVVLDHLPLTPNGKLDRKALPQVDGSAFQHKYEAPRTEREQQLAAIWQDVLGIEQVGLNDNFFELGGDSIVAIQLVSRARQQGIQFTPKDVFQHQSLGDLAEVAQVGDERIQIDQGSVTGAFNLLPIQRWFFEEAIPDRHHWNQSVLLKSTEQIQTHALQAALDQVLAHHDALRLSFAQKGAADWQVSFLPVTQSNSDVLWQSTVADLDDLKSLCNAAQRSLNLEHGPLLRAVLAELPGGEQRLLLVIHHLVVDGVSWRVLLEDLQTAYRQFLEKQSICLPLKTSSIQDWSQRLQDYVQSTEVQQELTYWQTELEAVQGDLPRDNPATGQQVKHTRSVNTHLDKVWTERLLKEAPGAYRTQINDLLLTALAQVIARWTEQESVLIQLEGHGREDLFNGIDLSRTVGWFTTMYPVKLSPADSLGQSIKTIKEQLRAVPDKGLGFGVLRNLGDETVRAQLSELAVPRITFNYLGQLDGSFAGQDSLFLPSNEDSGLGQSQDAPLGNWLTINGQVYNGELNLGWTFSGEMYRVETVQALADAYGEELRVLIEHCCREENQAVTPADFPLARLTQSQLDALPVPASEIEDIYPLSPMQEGMLLHTLLEPHSGMYFMQGGFFIEQNVNVELLERAWRAVANSYDALRASFWWATGDRSLQIIHKNTSAKLFRFVDVLGHSETQAQDRLAEYLREERQAGFRLDIEPPLKINVFRLADERYYCVISHHHILMDAWCHSLIISDFVSQYKALQAGDRLHRQSKVCYRDFIAWLQEKDVVQSLAFWREELCGFNQLTRLPYDRQTIPKDSHSVVDEIIVTLGRDCSRQLKHLSAGHQLTINTFLQAAWALVLSTYSDEKDVLFGVTVAGRPTDLPHLDEAVGLFINTIPLRVVIPEIGDTGSIKLWLQTLLEKNLLLREHEYVPLVEVQACSEIDKGLPLFDSLFVYENAPFKEETRKEASEIGVSSGASRTHTNYPITVIVYPGSEIHVGISYDQRYFDASTIQQLLKDVKQAAAGLINSFEKDFSQLSIPGHELEFLPGRRNSFREYPLIRGYAALFESQVTRHGERIVARCKNERWSYTELNQRANRLAHTLIEKSLSADKPVALLAERGLPLLGMINGVFKAAAGYLPLDISHPIERLATIMDSSSTEVIVCERAFQLLARDICGLLPAEQRPLIVVWDEVQANQPLCHNPKLQVTAQHLAYVIYTSGSTGVPKGVMVEQAGMLNNQLSKVPYLGLTESDVIAQTAPPVFDISVWQFLTAGLYGGCVEIVPDDISRDPAALLDYVNRSGITVLESVPSLISGMLLHEQVDMPGLRYLMPTGEAMPPGLARDWMERYPDIQLVNAYGPAECSDDVALHQVSLSDTESANLPVGDATDNNRLFVLNKSLLPMPPRAMGELYIAGTGVGRGYLADPARTAETFVPNAFAERPGERFYRSGDLVRRRYTDGVIEYIGRIDHQVKVRGFRIELGEIESRLHAMAAVQDAVVTVQGVGASDDQQLVAYIVPTDSCLVAGELDTDSETRSAFREQVKENLKRALPEYMVPNQYVLLPAMPLTPNGKLDRKALPEVDSSVFIRHYEPPRTDLEKLLTEIWQEVLGVEQVGVTDNFFELGGNSLRVLKVLSKVRAESSIDIKLKDMMSKPTIAELSGQVFTATPSTSLLPLNHRGVGLPKLFCPHAMYGTVFDYEPLARQLENQYAVYGIRCGMLLDNSTVSDSLPSMAIDYVNDIQTLQPNGPYHLLGWSIGGTLAVLMAHELEKRGESVAFLGLVDSFIPRPNALVAPAGHHPDLLEFISHIFGLTDQQLPDIDRVPESGDRVALEELFADIKNSCSRDTLYDDLDTGELARIFSVGMKLKQFSRQLQVTPSVVAKTYFWWVNVGIERDIMALEATCSGKVASEKISTTHYEILNSPRFLQAVKRYLT